jgi:hypothetical protein
MPCALVTREMTRCPSHRKYSTMPSPSMSIDQHRGEKAAMHEYHENRHETRKNSGIQEFPGIKLEAA